MNDGSGMEVIDVLSNKYETIKVIALSSYFKLSYTGQMMKKGFSAFLPKETTKKELLEVIYTVYKKRASSINRTDEYPTYANYS